MMSQGESEAWDMLAKARFTWQHLPSYMQLGKDNDTRSWLSFRANSSEIKVTPSTDKAGRGTDATTVLRDELARHPYGHDNFVSIRPCIDSGGQSIDLSTIDKFSHDNHFTERVLKAYRGATKKVLPSGLEIYTGGESRAALVFLGWRLRPVRTEGITLDEWFDQIKHKYSESFVEQEYPGTIEEALSAPEFGAFFERQSLEDMLLQVDSPNRVKVAFDTFDGVIRVYKPPVVGRQYVVFTDPSNGIEDPFATVVMDCRTGEGVCMAHGKLPAQEVARIHDTLVRAYNNAWNTGEVQTQAGGSFIDTLITLGTPNRVPRRSADGKVIPGKVGWQTNKPLRDKALHDLKEAVRKQLVTIHDRDAIEEFKFFAMNEAGRLEATGNNHDDWVMAWAGAWQINKYVAVGGWTIDTAKYKD